jgi:hypothetical protein
MVSKLGKRYTPMPKMVMNNFRNKIFKKSMRRVNMERGRLK